REGSIDESGTSLTMRDGEVHRKTPDGRISIIKFASYAFDLSAMTASNEGPSLNAGDRTLAFLLNPDPSDPHVQRSPGSYRSELHARLTEWLFPFMFALVSLVIAGDSRSHRQTRVHPMIIALGMAFALRWLGFSLKNLVKQDEAYIFLMYLLPTGTIGMCSYMLARNKRFRVPRALSNQIERLFRRIRQRWTDRAVAGGSR
ncbi:MAG TPA: LptF/LptG family permease, partial [Pseudorhizobium sp.]|nr:LptF/LptG family permease [Pseudorhizobium sp.]